MKQLEFILNGISETLSEIPPLKKAIVKAKKFRAKSPKDIDHLTFLALSISTVGAIDRSISILEFIDITVAVDQDSRTDLLSALANSRLVLAYCYRKKNSIKKLEEILSRDGLDECENFETYDSDLYENVIQEKLVEQSEYIEELSDEGATPTEFLRARHECLLDTIVLIEMLPSIQQTITSKDKADLQKTLKINEELLKACFTKVKKKA